MRGDAARDADTPRVDAMSRALVHRGPDDSGTFSQGPCAIAARRLSILDVARGHQPMRSADGRHAVVFNGEIYNAPELRGDLGNMGFEFSTRCDTEVLLNACIAWGDSAPEKLNGMFAFAYYDAESLRLLLVRDRLGIKPLYVLDADGDCYFASELDALLRTGLVKSGLNAGALDAYFTYLYIPGPETIFRNVTEIRPGEMMVWERGRSTVRTWWEPCFAADGNWNLGSASERYRELLISSVSMQQISDVPLGAFLSGGVDSATVVAAMSRSAAVETFTIGFEDPTADERAYADAVAKRCGTHHTSHVMEPDLVKMLPELIPRFGQPFADSSAIPMYLVSRLAREKVTVALSGDGGDELFAGYSWLHMSRRVASYRAVPELVRRAVDLLFASGSRWPLLEKFSRFSRDSLETPVEAFRRRHSCFYPEERIALYRPALADAVQREHRDRFRDHWETSPDLPDDDRMLRQDLVQYLPDDILSKVDRMSMAVSLEARVPILDHRIVEFAGSLPFELKYANGESKRVPKHAFQNLLPPIVFQQRKRGFSIPVDNWFRGPLKSFFESTVLGPDAQCDVWLNATEIRSIWSAHQSGRRNAGHRLWCLLAFELWLRYVAAYLEPGLD